MNRKPPTAILVDRRNYAALISGLLEEFSHEGDTGIDLETHNANAHAGILAYKDGEVFDVRRTVITGLSLYKDGSTVAYYFNLNHADVENRLTWDEVKVILDSNAGLWIAHNANFERTMLRVVYGYDLTNYICTMQMAVSAYNQDQYDPDLLRTVGIESFNPILGRAAIEFSTFAGRQHMTTAQNEVLAQVIGKSSKAAYSWNGLVKNIAYGYGLKQAVHSHFGFKMKTYEETLAGKAHMGLLTGEEVTDYGADDAYWAVELFHFLRDFMLKTNPMVLATFLKQENPMIEVFSDVWTDGLKINTENVKKQRNKERIDYANKLRLLKSLIRNQLPFNTEPHAGLARDDKAYLKGYQRYRDRIAAWSQVDDSGKTESEIVCQVSGAVASAWGEELESPIGDLNFAYYMTQRVIMYDLFDQKVIKSKGKVQSDGEARGKILEKLAGEQKQILDLINEMVGIEQRMKLYLNPYLMLIDPETNRVYPQLSSLLNTRRMAMSFPNAMQLSKRGDSTYIRGFYEPDEEDHVIISLDWSSFELVIIGELSGDPEFKKVFGQRPFGDLHTGAAVDVLSVTIPEMNEALFKNLSNMTVDEINAINPKILIQPNGDLLKPENAKKFWRVKLGKGANFNYWYSGALATIGDVMGWSSDTMWAATERYRERFSVAEKWRTDKIAELQDKGFLELPDHHRRVRFEATPEFRTFMLDQFGRREQLLRAPHKGLSTFGRTVVSAIQSRASNQGINALVQGTNAFVAKRTVLNIRKRIIEMALRARFMMPIHDEVVFSVHKDDAVEFTKMAKFEMRNHPDVFKNLLLDCTASVGRTFQPWNKDDGKLGQIELDELQADFLDYKKGSAVDDEGIRRIINEYLFAKS